MKKLKLAIVGMGRISKNHIAAAMDNTDELELVAICDIEEEQLNKALEKINNGELIKSYTDYKTMIDNEDLDLVAISTDSDKHAEIGMFCLEHNCHVIIEKPIAMSIKEADDLISKAEEKNLVLSACHQNRFNKSVQKLHDALSKDRFGKLSHIAAHVRWCRDENYYSQASWRGKWKSDGGCLLNQCIHNADLVSWILGDIEEVFAYTARQNHDYIEAEDLGLALIKAKSGAYALFEGTVNVYPKNLEETLFVFGEKGTVKLAGASVNLIDEWKFADDLEDADAIKNESFENPPNVYGFGHSRVYKNVIEAIRTGKKPLVDGIEGKKALELILAMYKSKKTGLPVKLPLEDFASIDMKGVF